MSSKGSKFLRELIGLGLLLFFIVILLTACDYPDLLLDEPTETWMFIVYGDTREYDTNHRAVLETIIEFSPDYEFIINVGDVVSNGELVSDWQTWQNACDDILGGAGQDSLPPKLMACPGNHDMVHTQGGLANWTTFLYGQAQQFGNDGVFFSFDHKNARFVILYSDYFYNYGRGPQFDMLMEAIQNNPKEWLFAFWHHPIFDFGPKEYRGDIHETWGISLYQYRCNFIFNGHAHYFARTKKLELNGEINPPLDSIRGTTQIVAGNGGADLYRLNPDEDENGYMIDSYTDEYYGYCEITVRKNILRFRHILVGGIVFDETYYMLNDYSN